MKRILLVLLSIVSFNIDAKEIVKTQHYKVFINKSTKYEIDPQLLLSICYTESRLQKNLTNKKSGASGICQLIPKYHKLDNYYDVKSNVELASSYLSKLSDKCNNDLYCVVNSYNSGYYRFKNKNYTNTQYYNKVMYYYNNYKFLPES